jgi:hypothetical protein
LLLDELKNIDIRQNVLIVNKDFSTNLDILRSFLYKLTLIRDCSKKYSDTLNILTFSENKKLFKKLVIDNPKSYFTNYNMKSHFGDDEWKNNSKKNVVVIDFAFFKGDLELLLCNPNVHLIILNQGYSSSDSEIFKQLGQNSLLINKKEKSSILHKKFYNKVVKKISEDMSEEMFLELTEKLNNTNLLVFRKGKFGSMKFLKQD